MCCKEELKRPAIKAMLYHRDHRTLMVWYTAGGIYMYYNVSEYMYRLLRLNAEGDAWPVLMRLVRNHAFKRLTTKAVAQRIPETAYFPAEVSETTDEPISA